MENTSTLFNTETKPEWFIATRETLIGPISGKDLSLLITGGKISVASFIWKEGLPNWQRLYTIEMFQNLLPPEPSQEFLAKAKEKIKASVTKLPEKSPQKLREWFLYLDSSQYGPFSEDELNLMARSGRIHDSVFLWKKGMADWKRAKEIPDLRVDFTPTAQPEEKKGSAPKTF